MKYYTSTPTDRELQVLGLIACGHTYKAAGNALGLSEQTIKNHMSTVLRRLSVPTGTAAIVLSLQRGLLDISELDVLVYGR